MANFEKGGRAAGRGLISLQFGLLLAAWHSEDVSKCPGGEEMGWSGKSSQFLIMGERRYGADADHGDVLA